MNGRRRVDPPKDAPEIIELSNSSPRCPKVMTEATEASPLAIWLTIFGATSGAAIALGSRCCYVWDMVGPRWV